MKKTLALILACLLLLSGSTALAEEQKSSKGKILSDWFDYLFACENLYADLQWALDAAQAYEENMTWENKQKAAMTITSAQMYISQRNLPQALAAAEDYDFFTAQGADVRAMPLERSGYDVIRSTVLNTLANLLEEVEYDSFWNYGRDFMQQFIALENEMQMLHWQALNLTTQYSILELGEDAETQHLMEFVALHCPSIHAAWPMGESDPQKLEAHMASVLDQMDAWVKKRNLLTGQQMAMLDIMTYCAEKDDWSPLMKEAAVIEGLPPMLPDPDWTMPGLTETLYYWKDAEGKILLPQERERVDRLPDGCQIVHSDVSAEEVILYCSSLIDMGVPCKVSEESPEKLLIFFTWEETILAIQWENETASLHVMGNPICFAPWWYIDAAAAQNP